MANESLTLSIEACNISSSAKSSLSNIVEDKSLKWIFVGGKGGVGKTTVSCSLAISLAESGRNVLLVSADPAHNVSDAFCRQFGNSPRPLKELPNLSVMEMNPHSKSGTDSSDGQTEEKLRKYLKNLPGVLECLAVANIIDTTPTDQYDVVVFDTAPTGHTVGMLSFSSQLPNIDRQIEITPQLDTLLSALEYNFSVVDDIEQFQDKLKNAYQKWKNPESTTFVCVCTADFLSIFETERLIQEVTLAGMDCRNIVVNQLIEDGGQDCQRCESKRRIQNDYLQHVYELFENFHVTEVPLVNDEVRGLAPLRSLANLLTKNPT
ncbi:ATPase ASNA1 homolog [Nesidiocoris tenuis]|uniref:ATPase ASNA1 homolog n=1 Tax=Nesidiocoris tenuis TaxID=355587 RepID=A0ABN7BFG4_9HEMI|nr:ATPase ASNA1 homolog [Nesidiocoris tenuis]